jgi:hypothetical protein
MVMTKPVDNTTWTGDTSHRAPEFTPEARADIARYLRWIGATVLPLLFVAVIVKGVI